MTERIPAAKAMIGYNLTTAGRVRNVIVIPDGRGGEWQRSGIPKVWEEADMTHGACFSDWLKGDHDMTPEWVFSEMMCFWGFADSGEADRAIAAFAQIEECAWARAMVPPKPSKKIHWRAA